MSKLSRRSVIAGAAALPALGAPAIAATATADPVYAGIEAVKVAHAKDLATCSAEPVSSNGRPASGTPAYKAWEAAHDAASGAAVDAMEDLLAIVPTTAAGAIAMIDAFIQCEGPGFGDDMADHLIGSLRAFLAGEA